jgi:Kef-type K+ transport system membrane component KefB
LFPFLAKLGVVALLFRIGLECNPKHLLRRLSGATRIWIANVTLSLGAVLTTALLLLDWALLPSLFAAVALIPRSEITLLVMQRGLDLGVVSQDAFAVVVAVVILTMGTVPLALRLLLPNVATT